MLKADCVCVESDATIGVAARCTIFEVALDRTSDVGQLAADLMVPAGMQIYVEQVVSAIADSNCMIFEAGQFGIGAPGGDYIAFVAFLDLDEPILKHVGFLGRGVADNGPVVLLEIAGAHLLNHTTQCFGGFRKQHNPTYRTVEAMDDTAVDLAGLVVADLDVLFDEVGQAGVACLVALRYLARQFVDGQQVVVLVEYLVGDGHTWTIRAR